MPPRKRKAPSTAGEQPEAKGSHVAPPQPDPPKLGLSKPARRRAVTRCYDEAAQRWEYEHENSFGNLGYWPLRLRVKEGLNFWQAVGCELCAAYQDYASADNHALEECQKWEHAPNAQNILRFLQEMTVQPAPAKVGAIDDEDDVPCSACSSPSKLCRVDGPRQTARDDAVANCKNINRARRAVAALLSFEDGVLADMLFEAPWVENDDPVAMNAWMAEQRETDRAYIPGILKALDDLTGAHKYLLADYEYRAVLRPPGKESENMAMVPRGRDGTLEFLADKMDVDVLATEQRLGVLKELILKRKADKAPEEDLEARNLDYEKSELEIRLRLLSHRKPLNLRFTEIQRRLLRFRDTCMVCKASGKPSHHNIRLCTNRLAQKAHAELVQIERAIHFGINRGCYRCGLPELVCNRWEDPVTEPEPLLIPFSGRCCFEGVALEFLFGIKYGYRTIWDAWLHRLEKVGLGRLRNNSGFQEIQRNLSDYLGKEKKSSELGYELRFAYSNNLAWEFEWMAQSVEKEL